MAERTKLPKDLGALKGVAALNQRLQDGTAELDWSAVEKAPSDALSELLAGLDLSTDADALGLDSIPEALADAVDAALSDDSSPAAGGKGGLSSADVREQIVDTLRLDLIGPGAGHKHEAEIIEDSPGRWYLSGFLVPYEARENVADRTENEIIDQLPPGGGTDDDVVPERASARRGLFPSSMGLSVLVGESTKELAVTFEWGDYERLDRRPEETQPAGEDDEDQPADKRRARRPRWQRSQQSVDLVVKVPEPGKRVRMDVPNSGGLSLEVHSRAVDVDAVGDGQLPQGTRTVSVFAVNHRPGAPDEVREEAFAFQTTLRVRCTNGLVARPNLRGLNTQDEDEQVADLQYRDVFEWAVGHNVATHATLTEAEGRQSCSEVCTEWVPTWHVEKTVPASLKGVNVSMEALAASKSAADVRAALELIVGEYGTWIAAQKKTNVSGDQRSNVLKELMHDAERVRDRIAAGFDVLEKDPLALKAFCLANKAMARQARQRDRDGFYSGDRVPSWRLFQVAFLLINLKGIAEPESDERDIVDLIFFPTGGGKTEAYLGLAAFTLLYRRLKNPGISSAGLSVLMRYTLRLLTLDQLARASALICALELERQDDPKVLGEWPFEIGLWVGQAATPNRMGKKGDKDDYNARSKVLRYQNDSTRNPVPIPLDSCPWCGAEFKPRSFSLLPDSDKPESLRIVCHSRRCDFNGDNPLPVVAVDDEIYRRLPSFLIATVDKFAALPWTGQTGALFGKVSRHDKQGFYGPCDPGTGGPIEGGRLPPPDLIIQDEVHLISGPLGTVAGLYEAAIEAHSTVDGVKPKLVASTATVRRARSQIQALFARSDVQVFPPPGPNLRDSFFAKTVPIARPGETNEDAANGRQYIGVAAQGRSGKVILHRVYLALLAAAQRAWKREGGDKAPKNPADPYMTVLGYFNALRELGGSRRIIEDEVTTRLRGYGSRKREGEKTSPLASRTLKGQVVELTSRVSTSEVAEVKRRLALPFSNEKRIDVALATNMISVGLDITRLGLMVVMGQPKASAEYIQATSRVGRDESRPGLVVTLLNVHKPRDRSHYERFEHYHETFYRSVEATSVTPFSPRAVDRAIAGVTVGLARLAFDELTPPRGASAVWKMGDEVEEYVLKVLGERAENHAKLSPEESEELRKMVTGRAKNLLQIWKKIADKEAEHGGLQYQREIEGPARLLHTPLDPERLKLTPKAWQQFKANRSLRDVEPTVNLRLKRLDDTEVDEDLGAKA